jgi:hypothetical protein
MVRKHMEFSPLMEVLFQGLKEKSWRRWVIERSVWLVEAG